MLFGIVQIFHIYIHLPSCPLWYHRHLKPQELAVLWCRPRPNKVGLLVFTFNVPRTAKKVVFLGDVWSQINEIFPVWNDGPAYQQQMDIKLMKCFELSFFVRCSFCWIMSSSNSIRFWWCLRSLQIEIYPSWWDISQIPDDIRRWKQWRVTVTSFPTLDFHVGVARKRKVAGCSSMLWISLTQFQWFASIRVYIIWIRILIWILNTCPGIYQQTCSPWFIIQSSVQFHPWSGHPDRHGPLEFGPFACLALWAEPL